MNWKKIRDDFPVTRERIYFMSAGMSPVPTPVLRRITDEYNKLNTSGDLFWERDIQAYKALCARLGWHVGAKGDDIAVVMNTSAAMSLIALSFKSESSGFNVVSMEDEFPSSTVPFEYQGIEMRYVEPQDARYPVEAVLEKVDGKTLAVLTSYVQYATGFRQDLEGLGAALKERGVLHIVNATQGFPLFPIDVEKMHIDAMSASLHKWGFAGHAGALFYTSPDFRKRFPAPIAGWLSVDTEGKDFIHTGKNKPFRLVDTADRYITGCINFQAINPLATSLDYLEGIGFEAIRERLFELTDRLIAGLTGQKVDIVTPLASRDERSAIVSFSLGDRTRDFLLRLARDHIYVSCRGGSIRVSVNIFNDEEEIDKLLAVVEEFKGAGR